MSMKPPLEADCDAWLTVKLHDFGGISIEGHHGDPVFARWLLNRGKNTALGQSYRRADRVHVPNRCPRAKTKAPPGTMKTVTDLGVVAWITLKLFGEDFAIEGHIGDANFVVWLLDSAADGLVQTAGDDMILVPNRDVTVTVSPYFGKVKPLGDMRPEDRGEFDPRFRGTES